MQTSINPKDLVEAKQHIFIALGELSSLPKNHEELVEQFRSYFEDQKVDVFSKFIYQQGEQGFREFISETVIESGLYMRGEDGQIRPKN